MTHHPTPDQRQLVQLHATIGTTQDDIARVIGVDPKTLRRHYRDELDLAALQANAVIGGALFNKAKSGDTTAQIFWMKTRAGWRETNRVEMTGADGGPIQAEDVTRDADAFASRMARLAASAVATGTGEADPASQG